MLYLTEVLFRIDSEHNFRDCDLKNFPSEKIPVQNFGIHYKDLEKGTFVSIDVRSACFIAMSLWQPNIFQKCRTWAEFIDKINGNDCLKNKITRNNHISLLGQKKQNVILNWIMFRIYSALVSELPNAANIFSPENSYDEIIIHFSQNMPENNIEQIKKLVFKVAEKICEERNNNILDPKEIFKVQEFKVMLIKDNKFKFYVKVYPDSFEIKGVPKEKREYYEEYCRKILSKN